MELTYTDVNGYKIPNLALPEQPQGDLGRWGRAREQFLRENKAAIYSFMVTQCSLKAHLLEVQETAAARIELITRQQAKAQGVTEDLKARDPMAWVGAMNNIRHAAEETVLRELVYS